MDESVDKNVQNPFLIGNKVYLRPFEEKDLEGRWHEWFNDPNVTKYLYKAIYPNTREKQKAHYEKVINSTSELALAIIDKKTNKHIGVISLYDINWVYRTAGISIVIGEKEFLGLDYGLEAMALLTQHGFLKMNLYKIYAGQHPKLERWKKVLEIIGYKEEARLKEELFSHGKYWDRVYISVFARDFKKLLEERDGKILGESIKELLKQQRKSKIGS